MARTDGDSWDLASSVGATATMVAAARALASREPDALIDDPYAAPLVRAVGIDFFTRLVDGEIAIPDDADGRRAIRLMTDVMAVRTRFFDDFFTRGHGARASGRRSSWPSGLDARAYRLPWPDGTVVYEIDQPQVIEFKTAHDGRRSAPSRPRERRTVAIDLRDDWPAALRDSGFDDTAADGVERRGPVGVSAARRAGPAVRQHHRARRAPGSRLATEYHPRRRREHRRARQARSRERWQRPRLRPRLRRSVLRGRTQPRRRLPGASTAGRSTPATGRRCSPTTAANSPIDDELAPLRDSLAVTAIRTGRTNTMARTDDDTWDLASSVGATATDGRRGAARWPPGDPRALIDDPFAEPLVRAVGIDFFTQDARRRDGSRRRSRSGHRTRRRR